MFVYLNSLQSSWSRENVESSTENCTEMALCRKFMENSMEHSWPQSWKKTWNTHHDNSWKHHVKTWKTSWNNMEQSWKIMKHHEHIMNKIWKNHGKKHGKHHESIFYLKMTRQIDLRNHQDRQLVETLREKADIFFSRKSWGKGWDMRLLI